MAKTVPMESIIDSIPSLPKPAMTFDIHLLDNLAYNDIEPLLENYIQEVLEEFADSAAGQAHIQEYPEGIDWIHTVIHMAHKYDDKTLPKLTKEDIQEMMEETLPRKLAVLDRKDLDNAIPQLAAFWTFLKETYTLHSAEAIIKYLRSIEDKFADWIYIAPPDEEEDITPPDEENDENDIDPWQAVMSGPFAKYVRELTDTEASMLKEQPITATEPGPILQDFEMLLELIGDKGLAISAKLQQFPLKALEDINNRLTKPITLALKRPVQKSYPPINGLYLLLRATGLVSVVGKGKKHCLVINQKVYDRWKILNPTERYFTLLEAWLIRGKDEMMGEKHSHQTQGHLCVQTWKALSTQTHYSFPKYKDQDILSYDPGLHNVALMELFGFISITSANPQPGKGWRIKAIDAFPFGQTMMTIFTMVSFHKGLLGRWKSEYDIMHPYNELQPFFAPYFPEWQTPFSLPQAAFRPGRHIFKVRLGKCWRRIAIDAKATLYTLSRLILDSVNFDYDHLDQFTYKDAMARKVMVEHPEGQMGVLTTEDVDVGELPIPVGGTMEYLFDFGDCWRFEVQLEAIERREPEDTDSKSNAKKGKKSTKATKKTSTRSNRKRQGEIIESYGKAPKQYSLPYDDAW